MCGFLLPAAGPDAFALVLAIVGYLALSRVHMPVFVLVPAGAAIGIAYRALLSFAGVA